MGRRRGRPSRGDHGFTLLEVMIVVMIIGLMAVWGYPALLKTLNRLKLTSIARETAIFMQQARMEAVKRNLNTEVLYLKDSDCPLGLPCLIAFTDIDGDGLFIDGLDDLIAGPHPLPKGIELRAPGEAKEDTSAIVGWDDGADPNDGPVYNTDGSASLGAFRYREPTGNFLEVRIEFLGTAKPTIKKFEDGGWYASGDPAHPWRW